MLLHLHVFTSRLVLITKVHFWKMYRQVSYKKFVMAYGRVGVFALMSFQEVRPQMCRSLTFADDNFTLSVGSVLETGPCAMRIVKPYNLLNILDNLLLIPS